MNEDIWLRFLQGDENAFASLYRNCFHELFAYGLKIGFNEDSCKDAIQDIFYKIFTTREQLTHIRNIKSYLFRSLKNRLFDIHHLESRINTIPPDENILESDFTAIEKIIEKETEAQKEDKIKQSLKELSPYQRKIIYYHFQLNLSNNEIAALLKLKPDTIKKTICRALQKMRENQHLIKSFFSSSIHNI